jgi:hypothetical protein
MELIADIARTDPQLADDLMRLLNEVVLARNETRRTPSAR